MQQSTINYLEQLHQQNQTLQINESFNLTLIDPVSANINATTRAAITSNALENIGLQTNTLQEQILINNYNALLHEIKINYQQMVLSVDLLLDWHRRLLQNLPVANPLAGQFKQRQNYIQDRATKQVLFTPPDANISPTLLVQLCQWYHQATNLDPLIKIPLFILDFLAIHPFNDGNGRISRLLTNLLALQNGCQFLKYSALEAQIWNQRYNYYEAIWQAQLNWHQQTNNYTPFIDFHLQILLACAHQFNSIIAFNQQVRDFALTNQEIAILLISQLRAQMIPITKTNIIKMARQYQQDLKPATIKNILQRLRAQQALLLINQNKRSYYDLVEPAWSQLMMAINNKPLKKRPVKDAFTL